MADLYITYAHPNPSGKDRPPHGGPSPAKLNEEWIQFLNNSAKTLDMNGVRLFHQAFNQFCQATGRIETVSFQGNMGPGISYRVHTGSGQAWWEGSVLHVFVGWSNYIWNNACGDTITLLNAAGVLIDVASYSPRPPEGKVLVRQSGTNLLR